MFLDGCFFVSSVELNIPTSLPRCKSSWKRVQIPTCRRKGSNSSTDVFAGLSIRRRLVWPTEEISCK